MKLGRNEFTPLSVVVDQLDASNAKRKRPRRQARYGRQTRRPSGVPKPKQISSSAQGIVRDEKGQEQPGDKPRAPHAAAKIKAKIRPVIRNKASKRSRLPCMANGAYFLSIAWEGFRPPVRESGS